MIRSLSRFLTDLKWRRQMRDLDKREADARKRGETRAIGAVRKERRERVLTALKGARA